MASSNLLHFLEQAWYLTWAVLLEFCLVWGKSHFTGSSLSCFHVTAIERFCLSFITHLICQLRRHKGHNPKCWYVRENEMVSLVIIDFKKLCSFQNAIKYTSCNGQCLTIMLHQWLTWVLGALTIQLLKLIIWKFSQISDAKNNKFFCPIDSWLIVVILKVWMPKYWCLILTYLAVVIVARHMPKFWCLIYDFCNWWIWKQRY